MLIYLYCSTAGNWLFSHRRWLDPCKMREKIVLEQAYDHLCTTFPEFAACSRLKFLDCITAVCSSWSSRVCESNSSMAPTLEIGAAAPSAPKGDSAADPDREHAALFQCDLAPVLPLVFSDSLFGPDADAACSCQQGPGQAPRADSCAVAAVEDGIAASLCEQWLSTPLWAEATNASSPCTETGSG